MSASHIDTFAGLGAPRLARTIETFRRDDVLYRRGREVHEVRLFEEAALRS